MSPRAYYNEHDPKAAEWLRELIKRGLIAAGDVDTRDIQDVSPHDLTEYTQQHFFAGIGGWSLALRLAGWPDNKPVRTGSCPCQPFSSGGLQLGEKDERHLWPQFRDLIAFGEPTVTFGEQVASALGREWLAGIRADLEALGYEVGAADLCAAGVAAPQLRQRLYWVANPHGKRFSRRSEPHVGALESEQQASRRGNALRCGDPSRLGNADDAGSQGRGLDRDGAGQRSPWASGVGVRGNDGTWRRVEPGIPPLAAKLPGRVALIRGSGNAIVPQLAAAFVEACSEILT